MTAPDRCPFCDFTKVHLIKASLGPRVQCRNPNCLAEGPVAKNGNEEVAIELWNFCVRRPKPFRVARYVIGGD